ncbi:MAG: hypothetical protein WKF54_10775 [Nocardioidaceae bacterium]
MTVSTRSRARRSVVVDDPLGADLIEVGAEVLDELAASTGSRS